VPLAELVADQSTKDAAFGELYHDSLLSLRKFAKREDLSYTAYERLKAAGKKRLHEEFYAIARRGNLSPYTGREWQGMYLEQVQSGLGMEPTDLFGDNENET